MKIWHVSIYEPLPWIKEKNRRMRVGLLAKALATRGHQTEIWLPTFEHIKKQQVFLESCKVKINKQISVQYLKSIPYKFDISLKRYFHNLFLACEFRKVAETKKRLPDGIIAQVPSLELAHACIEFAKKNKIPVFLDIRDLYPDNYKRIIPDFLKKWFSIIFCKQINQIKNMLLDSKAVFVISKSYQAWVENQVQPRKVKCYVFPLGCDQKRRKRTSKNDCFFKKYQIPKNKKLISFAGTFSSCYDFSFLAQASYLIEKKFTNQFHFVLAGVGELHKKTLNQISQLKNISLPGWLPADELDILYQKSYIGLAPYSANAEMSLPNKFFEFLKYNLPMACSLHGEMGEIIETENIGKVFSSSNETSFLTALKTISKKYLVMKKNLLRLQKEYDTDKIYLSFATKIEQEVCEYDPRSV